MYYIISDKFFLNFCFFQILDVVDNYPSHVTVTSSRPESYPLSERGEKIKKECSKKYTECEKEDGRVPSSFLYSRVALTVAVTLADYFAKTIKVKVAEPCTFRSPKGAIIEVHGQTSAKGSHIMPRGNAESRRNDFAYNKAINIIYQSKSNSYSRKRSFAVSQSLHAVAPWLRKSMHSEFQSFLFEKLNLPITS